MGVCHKPSTRGRGHLPTPASTEDSVPWPICRVSPTCVRGHWSCRLKQLRCAFPQNNSSKENALCNCWLTPTPPGRRQATVGGNGAVATPTGLCGVRRCYGSDNDSRVNQQLQSAFSLLLL